MDVAYIATQPELYIEREIMLMNYMREEFHRAEFDFEKLAIIDEAKRVALPEYFINELENDLKTGK